MSIHFAKNFLYKEVMCPCGCNKDRPINSKLAYLLQALRDKVNKPIYISIGGGIRCKKYNKKIGGYIDSPHLYGKAVDIHVKDMDIVSLVKQSKDIGFSRIGLYPFNHFIHLDVIRPYPSESWVRTGRSIKDYKYHYFKTLEEAIKFIGK